MRSVFILRIVHVVHIVVHIALPHDTFLSAKYLVEKAATIIRGDLVPTVGIELTTYRLQGGCSTSELCGHY
jgi:hypothetical protein